MLKFNLFYVIIMDFLLRKLLFTNTRFLLVKFYFDAKGLLFAIYKEKADVQLES